VTEITVQSALHLLLSCNGLADYCQDLCHYNRAAGSCKQSVLTMKGLLRSPRLQLATNARLDRVVSAVGRAWIQISQGAVNTSRTNMAGAAAHCDRLQGRQQKISSHVVDIT